MKFNGVCFWLWLRCRRTWLVVWALICSPAWAQQPVLLSPATALAASPAGTVAVVDNANRDLALFDANGVFMRRLTPVAPGRTRPLSIHSIAFAPGGDLVLLDRRDNALHVFSLQGVFARTIELAPANTPPRFNGLAVDALGRFFVSSNGGFINVFGAAGVFSNGENVTTVPATADSPGQLALDGSGKLYAVDRFNHRVLRLSTSGPAGRPLIWDGWIGGCSPPGPGCVAVTTSPGVGRTDGWCVASAGCGQSRNASGGGRFEAPVTLAATGGGALLVGDFGSGSVQRFDSAGRTQGPLAARGMAVGEIGSSDPVALGAGNRTYVLQPRLGRVTVFDASGNFLFVFGGGVTASVAAVGGVTVGDVPTRPLALRQTGAAGAQVTTLAVTSTGGYGGPVAFGAASCSTSATAPLSRPCSTFGLTAVLNPTGVTVSGGQSVTLQLSVSAMMSTPDDAYVLSLPIATPGLSAYVQVYADVKLDRSVSMAASPSRLTLMPGDPPAQVALTFGSVNYSGSVTLSAAYTPPPAAQHMAHSFPGGAQFNLAAGASATRVLEVTALPVARTSISTLNVAARLAGASPSPETLPVPVQVDCHCSSTGDFVLPRTRPVQATGALTGTSPDGNLEVTVTAAANGLPSSLRVASSANPNVALLDVQTPLGWGFSPNSGFFVVATPGPSSHITEIYVYDLSGPGRRVLSVQAQGCPLGDPTCRPPSSFCYAGPGTSANNACLGSGGGTQRPDFRVGVASWGFAPDSRSFLFAAVNPLVSDSQYALNLWRLPGAGAQAVPLLQHAGPTISSFWRFSPCGDLLMVFDQRSAGSPGIDGSARFFYTGSGAAAGSVFEQAQLVVNGGMVAAGPVGATVQRAFVSNGDFDVRLLNLSRLPSANPPPNASNGFQSPQCRRRLP